MAISGQSNLNRYYPFITNWSADKLKNDEIIEAHFFIVNPQKKTVSVWLKSAEYNDDNRVYVFENTEGNTLEFQVPDSEETLTVWSSEPTWNGFCTFGARRD